MKWMFILAESFMILMLLSCQDNISGEAQGTETLNQEESIPSQGLEGTEDQKKDELVEVFKGVNKNLPGYYMGEIKTPWTEPYIIAMNIKENGQYRAFNIKPDDYPAFYYGTDRDSEVKRLELTEISMSAELSGNIQILSEEGIEKTAWIKGLVFSDNYHNLTFEILHQNQSMPVAVSLNRVSEKDFPLIPVPTPHVTFTQVPEAVYPNESVEAYILEIESKPNLQVICQWSTWHSGIREMENLETLWKSEDNSFVCPDYITLKSVYSGKYLLVRYFDGKRYGGVHGQLIWTLVYSAQ